MQNGAFAAFWVRYAKAATPTYDWSARVTPTADVTTSEDEALIYKPLQPFQSRVDEIAATLVKNRIKSGIFKQVCNSIDPVDVVEFQKTFESQLSDFNPIGRYKYADIPFWIADKINIAIYLGLHEMAPRTILDIGMGGGHFAAVCRTLGHSVVGTDIDNPLYNDICRLLKVDRRIVRTKLRTKMPDLGAKFNFITVLNQIFDIAKFEGPGKITYWTPDDWSFFLRDLVCEHMSYPGAIFLHLNPNVTDRGLVSDPTLFQWARDHGAAVDEIAKKVLFTGVEGWNTFENAAGGAHETTE